MKWELDWNDPFTQYLAPFDQLVGDRRTCSRWTSMPAASTRFKP
jgi:hypothetical protein